MSRLKKGVLIHYLGQMQKMASAVEPFEQGGAHTT